MARSTLAGLVFAAFSPLFAQQTQQEPSFATAGVCSRCHVVSVLEWSSSKHAKVSTSCINCHGQSAGHVVNERNQVKPDRLPQDAAGIAALCSTCHNNGCPKSKKTTECQSCHHSHALSDPNDKRARPAAAPAVNPQFRARMTEGERQGKLGDWRAARDAFAEAARILPNDRLAAARLRMAERRLNPAIPGFEIIGDAFDAESGLPLRVRVAGIGVEMLLVPAGETDIGSDSWANSKPVHSVYTEPFYLGRYEVTQKQWSPLRLEDPSPQKGPDLPVHGISWNAAQSWIARLNATAGGGGFRLPTEAEWERAARPGGGALADVAWFRENSANAATGRFRESNDYTVHAAGLKRPNPLGFFDMQGNAAEWCSSLLRPYPYDARDGREDPQQEGLRVIRGGSFTDSPESLEVSFRHGDRPSRLNRWTGFRLARSVR